MSDYDQLNLFADEIGYHDEPSISYSKVKPKNAGKEVARDMFQTPNYATKLLLFYTPPTIKKVWECACGQNKITNVLRERGMEVVATDKEQFDFISKQYPSDQYFFFDAIITNPPFSRKKEFFERCIWENTPFALLLPFDISQWMLKAFDVYGCQALVPTRRIDYITPNGKQGKESSSQFHSFWLTRYFNLPKQLTVVTLSLEMKKDI